MLGGRIAARSLLGRLPLPAVMANASGLGVYANPAARRLLGLFPRRWSPRHMAALREAGAARDVVIRRAVAARGRWEGETQLVTLAGEAVPVWETVHLLPGDSERPLVHFFEDLTLRKRMDALTALAFYDSLTGLPNRNLLADRARQAIERALRSGSSFALLYVDVDGLKAVNDNAGHGAGDRCLRDIACALRQVLRKRDTVARLGGDEFVAIVEEVSGGRAVARVANKLLEACRSSACPATRLSASIGVSLFPQHGADLETLLERADAALYRAKNRGRDGWVLAEEARLSREVEDSGGCPAH